MRTFIVISHIDGHRVTTNVKAGSYEEAKLIVKGKLAAAV